jgi:hypothetical protein
LWASSKSKNKAPPKGRAQGDKKPAQAAQQPSHAPDAVSRDYRGKIASRKEYFAAEFVLRRDCAECLL